MGTVGCPVWLDNVEKLTFPKACAITGNTFVPAEPRQPLHNYLCQRSQRRRLKAENPSRWKWVRSKTCKLENKKWKISSIPSCNILHKWPHVRARTNKNKLLVLSYVTQLSPTCIEKSAFFGMFREPTRKLKELIVQPCRRPALSQGSAAFVFFFFLFFFNYRHIDLHLPVSLVPLSKTPRSKNELGPDTTRQQP